MFESQSTKGAGLQTKTVTIDPTKNIAAIGMKIEEDYVRGLRLMSDEQELLCDVAWCAQEEGIWVWQRLDDTEQILGVAVDTITDDERILLKWILGSEKSPEAALDTSGSWRPKLRRPAAFGEGPISEKSLARVEQLYRLDEMPKIKAIKYKSLDNDGPLTAF